MLRFAADENLNANVVRDVRLANANIDIVRVREAGLSGALLAECSLAGEWNGQVRYLPL